MNFVRIGAMEADPFWWAQMTFCPYFPDLLSDLDEIWFKISGYDTDVGGVHKSGSQVAVATNFHGDA